jgi:hypothetical protein
MVILSCYVEGRPPKPIATNAKSGNVRVRGQSGKHVLVLSSSQFDPKATWSDQPDGRMYANSPSPPRRKMLGCGHRASPHGGHMRRREFIVGTAATAALSFAWPACAQTNPRSSGVKRLAFFHPSEPPEGMASNGRYKAYFDELNRLGFIEGQNLIVERYSGLGQPLDRYEDFARSLLRSSRRSRR